MKQIQFNIFVYFLLLKICASQTLLYECNFDTGLIDGCRFSSTPGAPNLEASEGIISISIPTQPLSDVTSILSPTTPNNEYCSFPDKNPPSTWPMHFCQRNSETNYTCSTPSGTGNCVIGKYGLIKVPRIGVFDHTFTTINTIRGHTDDFQCLRLYYYITDATFDAKISVGWSAGGAPFFITEVQSNSENRWQNYSYSFRTPPQTNYNIWFQMLRDAGSATFFYALDEIKIFDGPCEPLTTMNPTTITSIEQMNTVENTSTDESDVSPSKTNTEIDTVSSNIITIHILSTTSISMPDFATNTMAPPTTDSTSKPSKTMSLSLILGLTLGLGLPIITVTSGGLLYYFKIFRPKQKIMVHDRNDNEIGMTSRHNTANNIDVENI